eukprot:19762-Pyramimonas_sp.AAC.1
MPQAVQHEPESTIISSYFFCFCSALAGPGGGVGKFSVTAAPGGGAGGVGSLLPLAPDSPFA